MSWDDRVDNSEEGMTELEEAKLQIEYMRDEIAAYRELSNQLAILIQSLENDLKQAGLENTLLDEYRKTLEMELSDSKKIIDLQIHEIETQKEQNNRSRCLMLYYQECLDNARALITINQNRNLELIDKLTKAGLY